MLAVGGVFCVLESLIAYHFRVARASPNYSKKIVFEFFLGNR